MIPQNLKKYVKCRQVGHKDHDVPAKCANCNGDYPAYTVSWPKWKIEKEYENNILFHEAW